MALVLAAGTVLVVAAPARAATTGLDGVITDASTGAPLAGANVLAIPRIGGSYGNATTDATGHYAIPQLAPGRYAIEVTKAGYLDQFAFDKDDLQSADLVTVPGTASLALRPLTFGSLTGQLTRHDGSTPFAGVGVLLTTVGGASVGFTTTDAAGGFTFSHVPARNYKVRFDPPHHIQLWAPSARTADTAGIYPVRTDATTTVSAAAPPLGNLTVNAVDANTGRPVGDGFLDYLSGPTQFDILQMDASGSGTATDLEPGTYRVRVFAQLPYLAATVDNLVVTDEGTATGTARMRLSTGFHVNVVDAQTGAPVTNYCISELGTHTHHEAHESDCLTDGQFDTMGFEPDQYKLFVKPTDGVHGAQWVGATGGTGDIDKAKSFDAKPGEQVSVTVRLDKGGSVSGFIRDKATNEVIQGCASVLPLGPQITGASWIGCSDLDQNGRYTIDSLGPYQWKVEFVEYSGVYAFQWSGGAAARDGATAVKVKPGATVTANAALRKAGTISGTVTLTGGGSPAGVVIVPVDADTGDVAGPFTQPDAAGKFAVAGLGNESVYLYLTPSQDNPTDEVRFPRKLRTDYGRTLRGVDITLN